MFEVGRFLGRPISRSAATGGGLAVEASCPACVADALDGAGWWASVCAGPVVRSWCQPGGVGAEGGKVKVTTLGVAGPD